MDKKFEAEKELKQSIESYKALLEKKKQEEESYAMVRYSFFVCNPEPEGKRGQNQVPEGGEGASPEAFQC